MATRAAANSGKRAKGKPMRQTIFRRDAPTAPKLADGSTAVTIAATSYRDTPSLYAGGVLTWAELVTKHRELRAVLHQTRLTSRAADGAANVTRLSASVVAKTLI